MTDEHPEESRSTPIEPERLDDLPRRRFSREQAEFMQFALQLRSMTPRVVVTPALVALNVGVFVVMLASGIDAFSPTGQQMLDWGGNAGTLTLGGEPWRLLTSMFLHAGLLHVGLNMYVLWDAGHLVERLTGNVGFAVLYLASGVAASLTSVASRPIGLSVGASGAVFGVIGALIGMLVMGRSTLPRAPFRRLSRSLILFVALNTAFGAAVPNIDMSAHFGGLVAGFLCGLFLYRPDMLLTNEGRSARDVVLAIVSAAVLTAVFVVLPRGEVEAQHRFVELGEVEMQCVDALQAALDANESGELSDEEFVDVLENEVIAPWRTMRDEMAAMDDLPDALHEPVDRAVRYATLRLRAWELLARAVREDDEELAREARRVNAEAEAAAMESDGDG